MQAIAHKREFLYLSTSRLHRGMANLVQTLKTSKAIGSLMPNRFTLFMPPARLVNISLDERLNELGASGVNLRFSSFLHSRWKKFKFWPFFMLYKKRLLKSMVFVRSWRLCQGLIRHSIPHVFEAHETDPILEAGADGINLLRHAAEAGIVRWVVAISDSLREELIKWGILAERVIVIPSGVDTGYFSGASPLIPERIKTPTLVHIGTVDRSRGEDIIKGIAERGYHILVAGRNSDRLQHSNIENFGLIPHNRVLSLYERAEIALIPYQPGLSTVNSFSSMKLIEAMACARIVIASDLRPIKEVVTDGKEAMLVPASEVSAWISAIEKVVKDPDFGLTLSKNAQKRAQFFDWSHRGKCILSLYDKDNHCKKALLF